jgi:hypothetical protein
VGGWLTSARHKRIGGRDGTEKGEREQMVDADGRVSAQVV